MKMTFKGLTPSGSHPQTHSPRDQPEVPRLDVKEAHVLTLKHWPE